MRRKRRPWAKLVAFSGVLIMLTILTMHHFATAMGQKMAPEPDPGGAVSQAGQCVQGYGRLRSLGDPVQQPF